MSLWSKADYEKALSVLMGRGFMPPFARKPGQSFYRWIRDDLGTGDPEKDFLVAWEISNLMAERKDAYYGKLFGDYLLIDIAFLSAFLSVYPLEDARELYCSGSLSRRAWDLFQLLGDGPRTTVALNHSLSVRDRKSRAETEKALTEPHARPRRVQGRRAQVSDQ